MIQKEAFVSISDVRDKTASVIKSLDTTGTKIVLSQNKPVGVFLSVERYNALRKTAFLKEQATKDDQKAYRESSHGDAGVEAFGFLDSLK